MSRMNVEINSNLELPSRLNKPRDISMYGRNESSVNKLVRFCYNGYQQMSEDSVRGRRTKFNFCTGTQSNEKFITPSSITVRKHVKKISEDFTLTQLNFESSHKRKSNMIKVDPSQLISPRVPRGLNFMQVTCKKCDDLASQPAVLPVIRSAGSIGTACGTAESVAGVDSHAITDCVDERSFVAMTSLSDALLDTLNLTIPSSLNGESKSSLVANSSSLDVINSGNEMRYRSSSRNRRHSASISPRIQRVTLQQLKRARQFTERAIKEGRVFSIYGHFPAVRAALKSRGWVEKLLHRAPYINPHPANCVCFQASCSSNSSTLISQSITLSSTVCADLHQTPKISIAPSRCTLNFVEINRKSCNYKRKRSIQIRNIEEAEFTQIDRNSENDAPCESQTDVDTTAEEIHASEREDISPDDCPEESEGLESDKSKKNSVKLTKFKFNPTTLCPLEIRCGFNKYINGTNESPLYTYTIPVFDATKRTKRQSEATIPEDETDHQALVSEHSSEMDEKLESLEEDEQSPKFVHAEDQEFFNDNEVRYDPFDPYPDLEFKVNDVDTTLVGRLLKNVEPNLIWTWTRDTISYKHLTKDQLVNRFPNTVFTTKHGLCSTMQQLHWFSEAPSVETFVPRGYCIGQAEERSAFQQDYRLTACLSLLVWLTETFATAGYSAVADSMGELLPRRVRQAVLQVDQFVESCSHDNLDTPVKPPLGDAEWDGIISTHHRAVHRRCKIKANPQQLEALVQESKETLQRTEPHWPQLAQDGIRNVWIVKPGAQSRGRGILLMHSLADILALVQSPFIYETKYVVQKYMERPFLIYNTKFDIRQWFMVTDWNPLTIWMYRSSYVRFCSQEYDVSRTDEAVHLSNNAIQCKYRNGLRDHRLPHENMWDSDTFNAFLEESGWGGAWKDTIYTGMKDALVAAMLAAQVQMDAFRNGFELFGADFMLSEDLRPWLIEINSSPCMAATSSVTRRLCAQCLQDIIKVVVDYRACRDADTGEFELIYRDTQTLQTAQPYHGVNLQVTGKQISRHPPPPPLDKPKRPLKPKAVAVPVRPLRLISLSMDNP